MTIPEVRMRQLVDWSAALWAGFFAGLLFLGINVLLTWLVMGAHPWLFMEYVASLVLGSEVLALPPTFSGLELACSLGVHFTLSMLYAMLIAYVIHRGGMVTGIIGGAVLGLFFFLINMYAFTVFFEWFFLMKHWVFLVSHLVFGAVAGGVYEAFEIEEFVPEALP